MSYGRIRRGPMAADSFTQIRNAVFRDPRLSAKAMGIFGNISTHRDGWGITPDSLSTQMRDGVDAIKSGLRELETHGYLRRTQTKKPDGTFGAAVYYITDQPEAFEDANALENRRSEPLGEIPPTAIPPADEPPAGDHLHKKTSSKHTSPKKTLSPPELPRQAAGAPPAPVDEREISPPEQDADLVLAAYTQALGRPVSAPIQLKIRDQTGKLLADGFPAWWIADRARELPAYGTDLAKHCEMSNVPVHVQRPADEDAPCTTHNQFTRMIRDKDGDLVNCPDCHPAEVARRRRQGAA